MVYNYYYIYEKNKKEEHKPAKDIITQKYIIRNPYFDMMRELIFYVNLKISI